MSAVQRAVGRSAEPTRQPPTATANARWPFLANLLEEFDRLRIVTVYSCSTEQTFDFSTGACVTTIEERDSKMILGFLAAVFGCVVGADCPSIGPDGGDGIPASGYPVLKTVTDLEPGIAILRTSAVSTIERLAGRLPAGGM